MRKQYTTKKVNCPRCNVPLKFIAYNYKNKLYLQAECCFSGYEELLKDYNLDKLDKKIR